MLLEMSYAEVAVIPSGFQVTLPEIGHAPARLPEIGNRLPVLAFPIPHRVRSHIAYICIPRFEKLDHLIALRVLIACIFCKDSLSREAIVSLKATISPARLVI